MPGGRRLCVCTCTRRKDSLPSSVVTQAFFGKKRKKGQGIRECEEEGEGRRAGQIVRVCCKCYARSFRYIDTWSLYLFLLYPLSFPFLL